jgi:hypothetical protein
MATTNEPNRPLEFLVSEANGQLSRLQVTIDASAPAMVAGTVLGKITASGKYTIYNNALANGTEIADAVLAYDVPDAAVDQIVTVIDRLAEVQSSLLNWGSNDAAGITAGTADLLAKNIKIRA